MRTLTAISVLAPCALWRQAFPPVVAVVRAAARRALRRGAAAAGFVLPARVEIGISLADDAHLRRLNRDWLKIIG